MLPPTGEQKRDELLLAQQAALFEYAAALMSMNGNSAGTGVIKPHPIVPGTLFPGPYQPVPLPVQYPLPISSSPVRTSIMDYETERDCDRITLPPISSVISQRQREDVLDTSSCSSGDALNV